MGRGLLIVNADDWGGHAEMTDVSLECFRAGSITSACEQGVDEHAGQFRLSFFYRNRRARLSTDADGRVLRRTVIDFGARPIAQSHHQSTAGSEKLTPAAQQQGERT